MINSGNIYEKVSGSDRMLIYVWAQEGGFTVTNWIGKVDGMLVKMGYLMFAIDGWNKKLYRNISWAGKWSGWVEI